MSGEHAEPQPEKPNARANGHADGAANGVHVLHERITAALSERPVIRIVGGELPRIVNEAESALLAANLNIFQRGELVVTPARVAVPVSGGRQAEAARLKQVTTPAIVEAMTQAADFQRLDGRSKAWKSVDCPDSVARTYLARAEWRLPMLLGVVHAPTLRPDGSILQTPGYDPATRLIFDPIGVKFAPIPERPTHDDARVALGVLHGLLATFPFVTDADRAVAVSAILTALVRPSLDHAPLHAFSSPTPGSGKSLLVDLSATIATGTRAPIVPQGKNEEETEKRLGAEMIQGAAVISIDNCSAPLGGDLLCMALTQDRVQLRVLGQSASVSAPASAMFYATGNNLRIAADLTRRVVLCQIDPGVEHPEEREFDVDPVEAALARRGELVGAALTIMRAQHVAGRPVQRPPLGSFGDWSRVVRDALIWAGEADPVATMEAARASDPRGEETRAVIEAWTRVFPDDHVSTRRLIARAAEESDLRDALMAVASSGKDISPQRLGNWIAKSKNRLVAGRKIVQASVSAGSNMWALQWGA